MTLFKLHTSPFNSDSAQSVLNLLQSEDGLLLTQDAVYLLSHPELLDKLKEVNCKLYMLQPDLDARGIKPVTGTQAISYDQMVALCLQYDKVISW